MPWVRIDEHALNHRKLLALSHAAFRLWVEGLAHCQKHLTDGAISSASVRGLRYAQPARIAELVCSVDGAAALWEKTTTGYQVHDYLQWNDDRAKVLQKRQKAIDRMRKLRGGSVACSREQEAERTPNVRDSTTTTTVPVEQEQKEICAEPAPPTAAPAPLSPVVLVYPCVGSGPKKWDLTEAQIAEWEQSFPALDVVSQCLEAAAWVKANTGKRKTARGMPAFLVRWLTRSNDTGRGLRQQPAKRTAEQYGGSASDWFSECQRLHGGACNGRSGHATQLVIDKGRAERAAQGAA